jgi:hypothetical protein
MLDYQRAWGRGERLAREGETWWTRAPHRLYKGERAELRQRLVLPRTTTTAFGGANGPALSDAVLLGLVPISVRRCLIFLGTDGPAFGSCSLRATIEIREAVIRREGDRA